MVEDTSKTPAGNGSGAELCAPSDADSGEQNASQGKRQEPGGEKEIGGRGGPDPTRYGDWEKAGRCIDF